MSGHPGSPSSGARQLDLETTVAFLRQAAVDARFVSQGDVADANGVHWFKARRLMPKHLFAVNEFAHGRGWPMLGAIVVEKDTRTTGIMGAGARKGFIKCAVYLGRFAGSDEAAELAFLQAEQQRAFAWSRSNPR